MATIEVESFGHLWGDAVADRVEDLRPYRDPHAAKHLRHLTANDEQVRAAVLGTPGIPGLIRDLAEWANKQAASVDTVTLAVGCAGGRHRAPTVAREVAQRLVAAGHTVVVRHRDMHKPVARRTVS